MHAMLPSLKLKSMTLFQKSSITLTNLYLHSKLFLLILIPSYLYFFSPISPTVFFSHKVNSFVGLRTNAIATLYFNSTNNTHYHYFPTLRLVSFKQPRYSNWMRCCAINKEGNAMLINIKRLMSKNLPIHLFPMHPFSNP